MGQKELLQEFVCLKEKNERYMGNSNDHAGYFNPLKPRWDLWLENLNLNYTTYISFWENSQPTICFGRRDILGDNYVNGPIFKKQHGVYIWLGCQWKRRTFGLRIGCSNNYSNASKQECTALDKLFTLRKETYESKYEKTYPTLEQLQENFLYDFIELVKVFNAVPREDFLLKDSVYLKGCKV
ncbi:hypothetical protein [Helicobacter bizzozeronii]|uniref:Uncharacterized protein n=1 Tax=Helicobacter bizzozeronii (strain CIII-1) TaxID=1002804 RepID=F8KP15_HELBC|nr:hypothetical protein [Helicobacter bizzozeronii]CCB80520.1 hypothetical protein HBZC1_15340 [Helicobacter bizzozeronii CIII-1]